MCQPCDELATCAGCTLLLAQRYSLSKNTYPGVRKALVKMERLIPFNYTHIRKHKTPNIRHYIY